MANNEDPDGIQPCALFAKIEKEMLFYLFIFLVGGGGFNLYKPLDIYNRLPGLYIVSKKNMENSILVLKGLL